MGAKVCLILGILLLSNIMFMPREAMANRLMLRELQTAEEQKSDAISYNPLKPGVAKRGAVRGKPYTRPCTYGRKCTPPGPPGHV